MLSNCHDLSTGQYQACLYRPEAVRLHCENGRLTVLLAPSIEGLAETDRYSPVSSAWRPIDAAELFGRMKDKAKVKRQKSKVKSSDSAKCTHEAYALAPAVGAEALLTFAF